MTEQDVFLKSLDGTVDLFFRSWKPTSRAPIATISFVHGLGEHIGRYEHWFPRFAEEGFIVNAYDQRGHGRSGGPKGVSPAIESNVDDIEVLLRQADPSLPHFLYGHSFGGRLVLEFAVAKHGKHGGPPLKGVISCAPALTLTKPPNKLVRYGSIVMSKLLPNMVINNTLDVSHLSRDESVCKKYQDEKSTQMVHSYISLNLAKGLVLGGEMFVKNAKSLGFPVPLLLIHGSDDLITNPKGTKMYFDSLDVPHKEHKEFPGLYHELHNEPEKDEVFEYVLGWLKRQLNA